MTPEPQMGLTFEHVWATIQEIAEQHKELAKQHEDTERFMKESKSELNRAIGNLGNRFGDLVEHLVSPNLVKKFNALGYAFGKSNPRTKYEDVKTGKTIAEVDIQLENGGCVLAVEVKTNPVINDVDEHVKRMGNIRRYADALNDKRDYIGAVAGGIMSESVKNYALKQGFYVLEQSGDTVNIAAVPEAWEPKKW
jgi:hypothetical protein